MIVKKRKCIFTNEPADASFIISKDKQNWTKAVPCTKEFLSKKDGKALTSSEFELVELFFMRELSQCKQENAELRLKEVKKSIDEGVEFYDEPEKDMEEIHDIEEEIENWEKAVTAVKELIELTEEDKEWLDAPMGPTELEVAVLASQASFGSEEKEIEKEIEKKIVKKKHNIWD